MRAVGSGGRALGRRGLAGLEDVVDALDRGLRRLRRFLLLAHRFFCSEPCSSEPNGKSDAKSNTYYVLKTHVSQERSKFGPLVLFELGLKRIALVHRIAGEATDVWGKVSM